MSSPAGAGSPGVAQIRTLALVGAAGAGKTLLSEALLVQSGMVSVSGSLEKGTTVSDHDPLERRVGHSLSTSILHVDHGGCRIHLIDTPGGPDFLGHSLPALEAVETVAVVIDATVGIEPMTVRMMDYAASRHLDRMIIVAKVDAADVNLAGLLASIQERFGRECLPLNLPGRNGAAVVDCFYNREGQCDFGSVESAHRALVEQVVEVDAAFVDRYLNDGDINATELHAPLEQALREGHLIPVCFTSAKSGAGISELLDICVKLLPNPTEGNPPDFLRGEGEAGTLMHASYDPSQHVLAQVFKVTVDPYVGKLGIMKVHQGTLSKNSLLYVGDSRKPFKVGHLFLLQGREHVEIDRALPGDICAVAKVDSLHFDAVLHDAAEDDHIHLMPLPFPVPLNGVAVSPKRRGDEQRLSDILGRLTAEDPCMKVEHVSSTNETILYGLGDLHLRMALERMRDVYKFEVETRPPRIAYRETVVKPAEGHHRHKKQSGGAGQFGEVFLRVEPLQRGAGFQFVDQVKGGTIPGQFIPAVEKGVRDVLMRGAVAGYPVIDVRVTVYDGKHHPVDSKEIAFVTAGRKAFVDAILKAQPIVLEPIVRVEITLPEAAIGDVTGDLSGRRGHISGSDIAAQGQAVIRCVAPLSELSGYQARLNSMTAGQARYTLALSHYEPVPPAMQQQLIAEYVIRDED